MRPIPVTPLRTERLYLREPVAADAPQIALLANNYEVVKRLAMLPHPYTDADGLRYIQDIVPLHSDWGVFLAEKDLLLGIIGLKPVEEEATAELGYWFGEPHWGKGYATEAGRAVVAYGMGEGGLKAIKSGHYEDNLGSARVLQKLGFRETGSSPLFNQVLNKECVHIDYYLD